jgi:hypothetical protein
MPAGRAVVTDREKQLSAIRSIIQRITAGDDERRRDFAEVKALLEQLQWRYFGRPRGRPSYFLRQQQR